MTSTRKYRVFIGLPTADPVGIAAIGYEPAQSVATVTVDGPVRSVPNMSDLVDTYQLFLERGTGPILDWWYPDEPNRKAGAFRVELTGEIDAGWSWQLAFCLAHGLYRYGRLASCKDTSPEHGTIWLTGAVSPGLAVYSIREAEQKLRRSVAFFEAHRDRDLIVAIPKDNAAAVTCARKPNPHDQGNALLPEWVSPKAIGNVRELLPLLELQLPPRSAIAESATSKQDATREPNLPTQPQQPKSNRFALNALALCAVGAGIVIWWLGSGGTLEQIGLVRPATIPIDPRPLATTEVNKSNDDIRPPLPMPARLEITELRAPQGRACAAVHQGTTEAVRVLASMTSSAVRSSARDRTLCGLEYRLSPSAGPFFATIEVVTSSGKSYLSRLAAPATMNGETPIDAPLTWQLNLPESLDETVDYQMILIAADKPLAQALAWFGREGDKISAAASLGRHEVPHRIVRHIVDR